MVDLLLEIDAAVFLFFNRTLGNPVFDWLMPIVTNAHYWRIPILVIWLSLMIWGKKKGRITAFLVVIILVLSDQLSSAVVKPWIGRVRPCFALENVRLLIDQPNSNSFPSSHAANISAMATLFTLQYPRFKWIYIAIAVIISYSRIAVGVHYPLDVLGGAFLGIGCAWIVILLNEQITSRIDQFNKNRRGKHAKEN